MRVRLSDSLPKMDRSYLLGHIQCVSGPALHLRPHSGYLVAQSAGSSYVGGAALVGRRRNVGERWFWTGALRGRSPCTREGRRPDRQETRSEEWENIFARLIQGCNAVAAGQLPLNQGPNGAKNMQMPAEGARHPEASKQREPCRWQHPNGSSSVCYIQNSNATITYSLGRFDLSIDAANSIFSIAAVGRR